MNDENVFTNSVNNEDTDMNEYANIDEEVTITNGLDDDYTDLTSSSDGNNEQAFDNNITDKDVNTENETENVYHETEQANAFTEKGQVYSTYPKETENVSEPKNKVVRAACLGLAFGLTASLTMAGVFGITGKLTNTNTVSQNTVTEVPIVRVSSNDIKTTESNDISDIVEQVMPGIVAINTVVEEKGRDWFGRQYTQESEGAGSGIIINETNGKLYILTNYHVVEGAKTVSVRFNDDTDVTASVKGYDEDGDIAVVEVDMSSMKNETKEAIAVSVIGDSDSLKAGNSAIAIGNALGYGQSVTTGVISATEREVELTDKTMTLIQTSAAINPGNSGGALLNDKGEVIGINTVKFSETSVEGMGYAIPINTAIQTAKSIIDGTYTVKTAENTALLGITGGTVDENSAKQYNMPQGVYVSSVLDGSAAKMAGLQAGCVITGFNGKDVKTMEELQEMISKCSPGDKVSITAQFPSGNDKYEEQELTIIIGAKSDSNDSENQAEEHSTPGFGEDEDEMPDIEDFFNDEWPFGR